MRLKLKSSDAFRLMYIVSVLCLISNLHLFAQNDSAVKNNQVKFIPGKQYEAGALHRFFLGDHWRDLWRSETTADVIDLKTFAGGLTPTKKGGGLQTKSLRLKGNDGNEYKFRLIDKSPVNSLPPELQRSVYADIIQDQVTIGIPASSVIVYPMMQAANILSVKQMIAFMPDDPSLGIFQKDFGGKTGVIEINPRAGKKGFNDFDGAEKVVNGFDIFKRTEKDNDDRVDAGEFLKARLFDVLIGDRDRHADQWQWARYDGGGKKKIWKPIPRDRDYAFSKYDGLLPYSSTLLVHSLVNYTKDYPSILELTWSGRHLDRRFLNSLNKRQWDSIALDLQKAITDSVIRYSVSQLSPAMFSEAGDYLISSLKNRRDHLKEATDEFYKVYSDVIDVYGSDKKEIAEITSLNDKELEINLFKRDKDTGEKKKEPFFHNVFSNEYTSEVRLNLLGDDDEVYIKGDTDNGILVRIETGNGDDKIVNLSEQQVKVYDDGYKTSLKEKSLYYNDDQYVISPEEKRYEPELEDRYGFIAYIPVLQYNSDDGFILGAGPNYTKFGFRADPYLYYIEGTGAYATSAKDYDIRLYGDFRKLVHKSKVEIFFKASELDFNRFYGFGNETLRDEELAEDDFYKTNQQDYSFRIKLSRILSEHFNINFNTLFNYSNVSINDEQLVGQLNPYGTGKLTSLGIGTGFSYEKLSNISFPESGLKYNFNAEFFPEIFNNKHNFGKLTADVVTYNTLPAFTKFTLVLRAGAEVMIGDYPYYYGATVGGLKNLRGFPRERFLGDACVFGQSELRMYLATINLFIPAKVGLDALGDIGRVFVKGEDSKKWHSTYGGGVWMNVLNTLSMSFNVAVSPEAVKYYFATGFTL